MREWLRNIVGDLRELVELHRKTLIQLTAIRESAASSTDVPSDAMQRLSALGRPLGPDDMLSPAEAARRIAGLGINAGEFWLEQQRLIIRIPAAEFARHRKTDHKVVIWGDVLQRVRAHQRQAATQARRRPKLKLGGLGGG